MEKPGYVYLDFASDQSEDGLLNTLRNPSTRASLVSYFQGVIGDPVVTDALIDAADRHGIDPALVVALSWQESGFRSTAYGINTNKTVDRGLMQLNSATFAFLDSDDFFNPHTNAEYGVSYLSEVLKSSGNMVAALAMYNAGPGRVGNTGAPRVTLDYISRVLEFKDNLIRGYEESYSSDGVLMTRDIKPVKNPDLL
ncbi:MAG: lytic transglycosylase domain-containing protein [Spirochaetaceae bacterium]|nr:lytic transglycosylase domain-containing protein [Spirochaetaceae bacterium]MDT8296806.1 lytic transglycosylase domain-containing protein [Spirochaetaceae bacterium]